MHHRFLVHSSSLIPLSIYEVSVRSAVLIHLYRKTSKQSCLLSVHLLMYLLCHQGLLESEVPSSIRFSSSLMLKLSPLVPFKFYFTAHCRSWPPGCKMAWLTCPSIRGSGCHGDIFPGDVQVQPRDGPERLLQSLSLSWPASNGWPTHLHSLTLNWPIWLLTPEVWSLCTPLPCPDQVTSRRWIGLHHLSCHVCWVWFQPLKKSMKSDSPMTTSSFFNHAPLFPSQWHHFVKVTMFHARVPYLTMFFFQHVSLFVGCCFACLLVLLHGLACFCFLSNIDSWMFLDRFLEYFSHKSCHVSSET